MTRATDGGFVLVDALLAAAILAFAGTVVLTIVLSGYERQGKDLDRSVALVAMQSLAAQFLLLTDEQRSRLEREDELFRYDIARVSSLTVELGGLSEWQITATPRTRGEPVQLTLLAR